MGAPYNDSSEIVIVTRHPALADHLAVIGLIPDGCRVIPHATEDDVRGKHVIGVLPLRMSALAASITEVPLDLPAELRGQELSLEQVRQFAGEPVTYQVRRHGLACTCGSGQPWERCQGICFGGGARDFCDYSPTADVISPAEEAREEKRLAARDDAREEKREWAAYQQWTNQR